jgi:ABC-type spermidine/putrescine transport system permease subunit II
VDKNDLLSREKATDSGGRVLRQEVTLLVHDDEAVGLDGLRVCFDDERVVCDAGAFLAPLVVLVVYSLWKTEGGVIIKEWTLANYERFFSDATYSGTLLRSFAFVGIAALLTVILTFPFAYFVATKVRPSRRIFWILVAIIPFWTSYLIRVFAWQTIFGDEGIANDFLMRIGLIGEPLQLLAFDRPAVVITFVYLLFPLGFLTSYIALERMDPALRESAADLGAPPWRVLTHISLPLARSGLAAGFVFAFITMMGDYVTPILIGGTEGILYSSLVVNQFGSSVQWGFGATLALLLLLCIFAMLVALRVAGGRTESVGEYTKRYERERSPFLATYSVLFMLFLYLPIGVLVLFAFNDSETVGFPINGLSTRWFETLSQNTGIADAFWTSIQVASIAVAISLVLGSLASVQLARVRGRWRNVSLALIALPLFLPPVVLGLGIIIGLNALEVQRGLWTIIAGHVLLTLPIVTLLLVVRLEGLDPNQELAALDLGARPWQAFLRVSIPQALPAVVAGAMLSFAFSMDEFILTFLVTGIDTTLPLYIYGSLRFTITPELNALSSALLGISFALVLLGSVLFYAPGRMRAALRWRRLRGSGA